jgi:hypothetical protein
MRSIGSIAEDYVERAADLDPALATFAGIAGHDQELPDLSADGLPNGPSWIARPSRLSMRPRRPGCYGEG